LGKLDFRPSGLAFLCFGVNPYGLTVKNTTPTRRRQCITFNPSTPSASLIASSCPITTGKGSFLNPYCQLLIKAVRVDSPPCKNGQQLAETLAEYRRRAMLTREALASKTGVSLETLKNWECGRTSPGKLRWPALKLLLKQNGSLHLKLSRQVLTRKWNAVCEILHFI
jgi:DNA-binding transcriptional regulator YiaG